MTIFTPMTVMTLVAVEVRETYPSADFAYAHHFWNGSNTFRIGMLLDGREYWVEVQAVRLQDSTLIGLVDHIVSQLMALVSKTPHMLIGSFSLD